MADYINKNILCQAYVHIEPNDITEESLEELRAHLTDFIKTRAEFFLYPDVEVDLEFRDGSLKVYATVLGTVSALYYAIAAYPDFKQGAAAMYEDAKRLSEYVVSESLFSTRSRHNEILRLEARTGVIGSLKKIINDLESIRHSNGNVSAKDMTKKLADAKEEIEKLLSNINSHEDEDLIASGLLEVMGGFPHTPTPPPKRKNSDSDIALYRSQVESIRNRLKQRKKPKK